LDKAREKGGIIRHGKQGPIPPELSTLISLHNTLSTLVTHAAQCHTSASTQYSSLLQSEHLPSPPVYLPRLTSLLQSLNESKEATLAVVKARTDLVKSLDVLTERQKRELAKSQNLLNEVDEQVRSVQITRDEVRNMMTEEGRSTTPDVEPPKVEALTPPPVEGDELAGLENLDPEIVALLRADMGLTKPVTTTQQNSVDEYAP
jgi:hypothetical protein